MENQIEELLYKINSLEKIGEFKSKHIKKLKSKLNDIKEATLNSQNTSKKFHDKIPIVKIDSSDESSKNYFEVKNQISYLKNELLKSDKKWSEMNQKNKDLLLENNQLNFYKKYYIREYLKFEAENKGLKVKNESLQRNLKFLESKFTSFKNEMSYFQNDSKEILIKQIFDLREVIQNKENEIKAINKNHKKIFEDIKKDIKRDNNNISVNERIRNLTAENNIIIRENNELQNKIKKIKLMYKDTDINPDVEVKINALEIKSNMYKKDILELNEQIQNQKNVINNLIEVNKKLQDFVKNKGFVAPFNKLVEDEEIYKNELKDDSETEISPKIHSSVRYHMDRRENGKFGSLPSFDNYDDDYNEKDDENNIEY